MIVGQCTYVHADRGRCYLTPHPDGTPHQFARPASCSTSMPCAADEHDICISSSAATWCACPCHIEQAVDHPAHYGGADDPYETIKVIEAWLTPEQASGFRIGNAVKYISRAGKKDENRLRDLRKAAWYLNREIENRS
jgi:hypothetical protein